jgi:hypothetical protein
MAKGPKGGVVRFVDINGVIVPTGYELVAKGDISRFSKWMNINVEEVGHLSELHPIRTPVPICLAKPTSSQKKIVTTSPRDAKKVFNNDLSSEKDDELAPNLRTRVWESTSATLHVPPDKIFINLSPRRF